MEFLGKYSFQSTNPTGARKYLTSGASFGKTYPLVAADTVTEVERWIVYRASADDLVLQMGNGYYLSSVEQVGWIIGAASRTEAFAFRIVPGGSAAAGEGDAAQVALQIFLPETRAWVPVFYAVDTITPYLEFPLAGPAPSGPGTYQALAQVTITPSLAAIQASRNGRDCDLRGVDLRGADLSGVDLTGADFTGAALDGTVFDGAVLTGATLIGATLAGTSVAGATLDRADFTGCDVSGVAWGEGILARKTKFIGCVGQGCLIGSPDVSPRADLTGADLTGADFTGSDFSHAVLAGTTMVGGVFVGAAFEAVDFTGAQLGGLAGTPAAVLAFAYLPDAVFTRANLFAVDFAFCSLFGASAALSDATSLEQADFSNAYLAGISLAGAKLDGAKFDNACLVNVDFTGAALTPTSSGSSPASLAGACLHGAIFTAANLDATVLAEATVAFAEGSINVRYCNPLVGGPFPPPPAFEPLRYRATAGLDLSTMVATTLCPDGLTVAANQRRGNTLHQMLTVTSPATEWVPVRCAGSSHDADADSAGASGAAAAQGAVRHAILVETADAVLRTPYHLRLRDLRTLLADPDARRELIGDQPLCDDQLRALILHYRRQHRRTGRSAWPAFRKADRAFIGIFQISDSSSAGGREVCAAVLSPFRGSPVVEQLHRAVLAQLDANRGSSRSAGPAAGSPG